MKLILFTNLSKMPSITEKLDGFGANDKNIAIVHQNNTSLYDEGVNNLPENPEVILVNDNETLEDEGKSVILKLIDNDTDIFVVYHKNTQHRQSQEDVFKGINLQETSDSHVEGSIYHDIDNWMKDGCNHANLLNIIKKHFPDKKLVAVIKFLHLCLNDKIEDDYLKILQDAGIEVGNGDDDSIKALFEKVKNLSKDSKKNQELAVLRDALFGKLGTI